MNKLGTGINILISVFKKLAGAKLTTHRMGLVSVYLLLMYWLSNLVVCYNLTFKSHPNL